MSREHTQKEIQDMFLEHIRGITSYWANLPNKTPEERTNGVAFSILALLDGVSADLPAFEVIPVPHPSDKAFHQEEGTNYYPDPPRALEGAITVHGPDMLHDLLKA